MLVLIVCLCVFSQIQIYQLSRLLHDYHRDLYNHFEEHEICPSLYAAPWFLTLFASQFPLGFVSRIFGIFLEEWPPVFAHTQMLISAMPFAKEAGI